MAHRDKRKIIERDTLGRRTDKVGRREHETILRLHRTGATSAEIAKQLHPRRDPRTVRAQIAKGDAEGRTEYLWRIHQGNLQAQLQVLRSCLTDPQLPLAPGFGRKPLEIHQRDYRLDPVLWVCLCTPYLSEEDEWGPEFPLLKAHMKNSAFWSHHHQLWIMAEWLEGDYDTAAKEIGKQDKGFRHTWAAIRKKRPASRPSRIPGYIEPDWDRYQPSCEQERCDAIIDRLASVTSVFKNGICDRLCDLEKKLEEMNTDLLHTKISKLLAEGHCQECPK